MRLRDKKEGEEEEKRGVSGEGSSFWLALPCMRRRSTPFA